MIIIILKTIFYRIYGAEFVLYLFSAGQFGKLPALIKSYPKPAERKNKYKAAVGHLSQRAEMLFGPRKALTQKAKKNFPDGSPPPATARNKRVRTRCCQRKRREFSQRRRSVSTFRPSASLLRYFSPPSLRHHHTEHLYLDGLQRLMQTDVFLLVQVVGLLFSISILHTNTHC